MFGKKVSDSIATKYYELGEQARLTIATHKLLSCFASGATKVATRNQVKDSLAALKSGLSTNPAWAGTASDKLDEPLRVRCKAALLLK